MTIRKYAAKLAIGVLVLALSVGCSRTPTGTTPGVNDPNSPGFNDPNGGYDPNNPNGGNGGWNDPNGGNGGWNNNPGSVYPGNPAQPMPVNLTATVGSKERFGGFLLWAKKLKATVQVNNPSQQQVSGTLTLTFTKKGESVETQTQNIDLGPGETKSIEVKSTKSADDVTAYAQSNIPLNPGTGFNPGTGGSFPGSGGSYPGTGGSFPGGGGSYPGTY